MNKIIITGNLVRDIEISTTNAGKAFTKFTVAVQRPFTNKNGEKETDFINCIAWENKAELLAKYTKKGDRLGIVGNLRIGSYEAKDGTKRYTADIFVEEIEFLNVKNNAESSKSKMTEVTDDSLPF